MKVPAPSTSPSRWLGAALLATACGRPHAPASTAPSADPAATSRNDSVVDPPPYPPTDRAWGLDDYLAARDRIVATAAARATLPSPDGEDAAVFTHLVAIEEVRASLRESDDPLHALDLLEALRDVRQAYLLRVTDGDAAYADELTRIAAPFLLVSAHVFDLVSPEDSDSGPAIEPMRLEGLQQARLGVAVSLLSVLASPQDPTVPGVKADEVAATVAPIAAELSPLLLPGERAMAREIVAGLAADGAAAADTDTLLAALADDVPAHPFVQRDGSHTEPDEDDLRLRPEPTSVPMGVPSRVPGG